MAKAAPKPRMGSIVTFRVTDDLFSKLSEKAEENHESVSDLIRRTLRSAFDIPIGYKCKHAYVIFQEGVEPEMISMECGCDMQPMYDMPEIVGGGARG